MVVFGREPIERDRHLLAETATREIGNLAGGNGPELRVRGRIIPSMVEDAPRTRAPAHDRLADEGAELGVVHRRVRAERDEIIERRDARPELPLEQLEHHRHRHRPRAVRDDDEHPAPVDWHRSQPFARDGVQLLAAQIAFDDALPDSHK